MLQDGVLRFALKFTCGKIPFQLFKNYRKNVQL